MPVCATTKFRSQPLYLLLSAGYIRNWTAVCSTLARKVLPSEAILGTAAQEEKEKEKERNEQPRRRGTINRNWVRFVRSTPASKMPSLPPIAQANRVRSFGGRGSKPTRVWESAFKQLGSFCQEHASVEIAFLTTSRYRGEIGFVFSEGRNSNQLGFGSPPSNHARGA